MKDLIEHCDEHCGFSSDIRRFEHSVACEARRKAIAALDRPATVEGEVIEADRKAIAALHELQHDGSVLASPPQWGGSILAWAATEIKALRLARSAPKDVPEG